MTGWPLTEAPTTQNPENESLSGKLRMSYLRGAAATKSVLKGRNLFREVAYGIVMAVKEPHPPKHGILTRAFIESLPAAMLPVHSGPTDSLPLVTETFW